MFGPHAKPDGDFPNVPGHVSNPENPAGVRRDHRAGQGSRAPTWRWRPIRIATASAAPRRSRIAKDAAVAHAHRQSDRRAAGRLRARELEAGRPAHAAAFHRRDAGHHAAHPPHRRQLRRADDRRLAGRLQMDRRGDRRVRAGAISSSAPKNRTATWPGTYVRDKDGAVASMLACELAAQAQGGRANAARKARRAVLAAWRARRADAHRADAGQRRHGPDAGSDGGVSQPAADRARRRPRGADSRLRAADRDAPPAASRSRSPGRRATW